MVYWNLLSEFVKVRSRKRTPCLPRLSSSAIVNTDLKPTGSVLAGGELWAAETVRGNSIQHSATVTVVGFRDHVLVVEEPIVGSSWHGVCSRDDRHDTEYTKSLTVPPPPTSPERRLPLRQLPSERPFSAFPPKRGLGQK